MVNLLEELCNVAIGPTNDRIAIRDGANIALVISGDKRPDDNMYLSSGMLYHLKRAAQFLEKKRSRAALLEIEKVIAIANKYPNLRNSYYIDALIGWSEASFNLKYYRYSREFLEEVLEIAPNNIKALILDGKANRVGCEYSRQSDDLLNRVLMKVGLERTEKIEPNYERATQSLEKAREIIESKDHRYGIIESDKKKYERDIYLHLGGVYRSIFEEDENGMEIDTAIEWLEKTAETYHKAFLAKPKATDKEASHIHSSLAYLYSEIVRLKTQNIGGKPPVIDGKLKTNYDEAVKKAKKYGWEPKIEASNSLRKAYNKNKAFIAPLISLSKLHASSANYISRQLRR